MKMIYNTCHLLDVVSGPSCIGHSLENLGCGVSSSILFFPVVVGLFLPLGGYGMVCVSLVGLVRWEGIERAVKSIVSGKGFVAVNAEQVVEPLLDSVDL
jgi:uncharacterized membrane protein